MGDLAWHPNQRAWGWKELRMFWSLLGERGRGSDVDVGRGIDTKYGMGPWWIVEGTDEE